MVIKNYFSKYNYYSRSYANNLLCYSLLYHKILAPFLDSFLLLYLDCHKILFHIYLIQLINYYILYYRYNVQYHNIFQL